MVKKLHKASVAYPDWKVLNNPNYKPWHFPEQIAAPRIRVIDVSIFLYNFMVYRRDMLLKGTGVAISNYDHCVNTLVVCKVCRRKKFEESLC